MAHRGQWPQPMFNDESNGFHKCILGGLFGYRSITQLKWAMLFDFQTAKREWKRVVL